MTNLMKASLETMTKGIDSLKNIKKDKQEYKEFLGRIKALPDDFAFVYEKMTEYMWSYSGGGDGYDMIALQGGLLELFEAGAANKKSVTDITGTDIAAFCDDLLRNAVTYTEKRRDKLNREVQKKLEGKQS